MFNTLRLKLTAGSILKVLMLIALVSGLSYGLVISYIGYNRDQALRRKMALVHHELGLPVPTGLSLPKGTEGSDQDWQIIDQIEEPYDDNSAASFITPLDAQARPILNLPGDLKWRPAPELLDRAAVVQAADRNGSDLRTIFFSNDIQVRLLTYRLPAGAPMAYLQVGRLLADEDRLKHRLLLILFVGGIFFTLVAGYFSWKLTGRSLRSAWQVWERQQAFVANASHELRAPLTLIRVSVQVVQQSLAPDNPQRLLMDDVLSETDHMARLVDDLLLLSRLDARKLKLDLQTIQLSELLPRIQRQFVSLAKEHGVSIRIKQAEGCVNADPTRLWQVLLILVDNALRHTPANGLVTLGAHVQDKFVHVSVSDTGQGIATEDLPHVFERFYKTDNILGDRRSAGLGLSIAQPLVELHGGEITIDSQVGIGTRVTIILPAHRGSPYIEKIPMLESF